MKKPLSKGVYASTYSIRAIVNCAAGRKEKRFDHDTPLAEIKKWRNETKTKLERLHPQQRAGRMGQRTFSASMKRYLKTLAIASWKSTRSCLRAWEARIGSKRRSRVTADDVRLTIKAWFDAGVPPKTILNRVRALTAMYHALDGEHAWTPADDVMLPNVPKRLPGYVAVPTILDVERRLRAGDDPQTHARYMVLTSTGARPAHLKRTKAIDVDLERRTWRIIGAKGGEAIELWLNDDMLAAWQTFVAAQAWGDFDATAYARAVHAAGWPAGVRPYLAKHSVGRDMGDRGVDLETIADWYGHTDTKTARIYTGAMARKLKAASEALNGRLGWIHEDKLAGNVGRPADTTRKRLAGKALRLVGES